MKFFNLFTLLLFLGLSSCKKEQNDIEGLIRFTGDYAVDGCGYFIEISGKTYKPDNEIDIPDTFSAVDSAFVILDFNFGKKDFEYYCGDWPSVQKKPAIHVLDISFK